MKVLCLFVIFIFLGGCQSRKKGDIDKNILNAEKNISDTESILKKIPTSEKYKNLKPVFSTNGKSIYLSYGNFKRDYNYKIDTLKEIEFLDEVSFDNLKKNIYSLSKVGISEQDYVIYNPDTWAGIYIYRYKYEDWMSDEPEKITYVALIRDADKTDQWFNNTFKIITTKGSFALLTKIRG